MKLTTRGHYSVKAMLDLCLQVPGTVSPVSAIAKRQAIPAPYLEKLLIELRRAGLVSSVRGPQGGYQLARRPEEIFLGEIFAAVGENLTPLGEAFALANSRSDCAEDWVTLALWRQLRSKLRGVLLGISLADLYYDTRSRQAAQGKDTGFMV